MGKDLALPSGACDCHVHVIGPFKQYPMVADRHYTPGPASVKALTEHLAKTGLSRAVIIQPSVYGTDNTCLLDCLDALGDAGRGIAVVAQDATGQELQALSARGVRGLRVNVESASLQDGKALGRTLFDWAERVAALNWHLQVYASLNTLAVAVPFLAKLPVPVVLDHFAMVPGSSSDTDVRLAAVLQLVRAGQAYVKLSAPYRLGFADVDSGAAAARLAALFLKANPERVLWGSDWPHTNREAGKLAHEVSAYRSFPSGSLLQDLSSWLPESQLLQHVLVDNPARLYRF